MEHAEKNLEMTGEAFFSEIKEKDLKENVLILFKLLSLSKMYELNCYEEKIKYVNFTSLYYSVF